MGNATELVWSLLFGSIGFGYFLYGKKQMKFVPLLSGIALMGYTYFMPNAAVLVLVGVILAAVPYFFRD